MPLVFQNGSNCDSARLNASEHLNGYSLEMLTYYEPDNVTDGAPYHRSLSEYRVLSRRLDWKPNAGGIRKSEFHQRKEVGDQMTIRKSAAVIVVAFLFMIFGMSWHGQTHARVASLKADLSTHSFLGRWDLTLRVPDREYASWLEVSEENGKLKAQMVGRWGNARPLPSVQISDGHIKFVSPKDEEGSKTDMVFEGSLSGEKLSGTVNGPDGKTWQWTGCGLLP